jgi:hypothetical protein
MAADSGEMPSSLVLLLLQQWRSEKWRGSVNWFADRNVRAPSNLALLPTM